MLANRYAPHDTNHLVDVMGGNVSVCRLSGDFIWRWVSGYLRIATWPLLRCECVKEKINTCGLTISRPDITWLVMSLRSRYVHKPHQHLTTQLSSYRRRRLGTITPTIRQNQSTVCETSSSLTSTSVSSVGLVYIFELISCFQAPDGIPGNDDQAAMASLLSWHLLGLYPGKIYSHSVDFWLG